MVNMAEHLTPDQVARFKQRKLSPAEWLAFHEHLATCEPCRQAVSDPLWVQAAYTSLQQDVKDGEQLGLNHLTYEQMEAYVDDELYDADLETVESHIELCPTCREELRDLREFRDSLESRDLASGGSHLESLEPLTIFASADEQHIAPRLDSTRHKLSSKRLTLDASADDQYSASRADNARRKLIHFWRYPGYLAAVSAACAMVVAAVWFLPQLHHTAEPNHAQVPQNSQPGDQAPTNQFVVKTAPPQQDLHPPAGLNALTGETGTLLGETVQADSFAVLAPVGTYVEDVQPVFRWQALSGASRYKVTVVDTALQGVLESPAISGTSWKATTALQRDKVYLWQVTAFRNSEQAVAPSPPAPEARFEVIGQSQADQLTQLKMSVPIDHFALGSAYANAGVLDDAERELRLVSGSDANYGLAQKFIADIEALRHPPRNPK